MGANEPDQMHELFTKFFNSKDIDGLLTLYEDNAVLLSAPGQPVTGKAAIKDAIAMFLSMGGTMEFINESAPVVNGDIALTHGKWRLTPETGDAMEGSTAEVVRKGADGTWRYAVDNPWGSSVLDA